MYRDALAILIFVSSSNLISAQEGQKLTLQQLSDGITTYLQGELSATKNHPATQDDLSWARHLYVAALRTKIARQEFETSVLNYDKLLARHGNLLEKEEAYFAVGMSADALLTTLEDFRAVIDDSSLQLDLKARTVAEELGLYTGQRGVTLHSVLDKPQLLGMTDPQVASLLKQLDVTGKHLDAAIDALRSMLLQQFPNQDLTQTLQTR